MGGRVWVGASNNRMHSDAHSARALADGRSRSLKGATVLDGEGRSASFDMPRRLVQEATRM